MKKKIPLTKAKNNQEIWKDIYPTICIISLYGLVVNMLDIVVSSNSSQAVAFTLGHAPWERYEPSYPPSCELNSTITVFFL